MLEHYNTITLNHSYLIMQKSAPGGYKQPIILFNSIFFLLAGFILCVFFLNGCSENGPAIVQGPAEVETSGEKIHITDQTGKQWDITHAVNEYGMQPENWQYGLGPNWFAPLILPKMICPGEPGYPGDNFFRNLNSDLVIGAEFEGDARAYPLTILFNHEVANEKFGETHVAVAY